MCTFYICNFGTVICNNFIERGEPYLEQHKCRHLEIVDNLLPAQLLIKSTSLKKFFLYLEWSPSEEDASDKKAWEEQWDQADMENDQFTEHLR